MIGSFIIKTVFSPKDQVLYNTMCKKKTKACGITDCKTYPWIGGYNK